MEFFNSDIGWLFFAYTAGSLVGFYFGFKSNVIKISEQVIDSLIEQGFLKTRGYGKNMEILKYTEWCEKESN